MNSQEAAGTTSGEGKRLRLPTQPNSLGASILLQLAQRKSATDSELAILLGKGRASVSSRRTKLTRSRFVQAAGYASNRETTWKATPDGLLLAQGFQVQGQSTPNEMSKTGIMGSIHLLPETADGFRIDQVWRPGNPLGSWYGAINRLTALNTASDGSDEDEHHVFDDPKVLERFRDAPWDEQEIWAQALLFLIQEVTEPVEPDRERALPFLAGMNLLRSTDLSDEEVAGWATSGLLLLSFTLMEDPLIPEVLKEALGKVQIGTPHLTSIAVWEGQSTHDQIIRRLQHCAVSDNPRLHSSIWAYANTIDQIRQRLHAEMEVTEKIRGFPQVVCFFQRHQPLQKAKDNLVRQVASYLLGGVLQKPSAPTRAIGEGLRLLDLDPWQAGILTFFIGQATGVTNRLTRVLAGLLVERFAGVSLCAKEDLWDRLEMAYVLNSPKAERGENWRVPSKFHFEAFIPLVPLQYRPLVDDALELTKGAEESQVGTSVPRVSALARKGTAKLPPRNP